MFGFWVAVRLYLKVEASVSKEKGTGSRKQLSPPLVYWDFNLFFDRGRHVPLSPSELECAGAGRTKVPSEEGQTLTLPAPFVSVSCDSYA